MSNRKYLLRPDTPDIRDLVCRVPRLKAGVEMPEKVCLAHMMPAVYEQETLGSCTAQALAAAHWYQQIRQGAKELCAPSRLFIYYNERRMAGTLDFDAGASLRDGCKSLVKEGVCPEEDWPYVIKRYREEPPKACYKKALDHQVTEYQRLIPVLDLLKRCLIDGWPIVFGASLYESFEDKKTAKTGIVPMPNAKRERLLGGHALLIAGYYNKRKAFLVRNSWGVLWGIRGYCWMPYEYITNDDLATDFWVLKTVE